MQYRMNYEIEDLFALLQNRDAWIPSEDSSDRRLLGYTLWLGSAIRAYVAGIGDSWAAWPLPPGWTSGLRLMYVISTPVRRLWSAGVLNAKLMRCCGAKP